LYRIIPDFAMAPDPVQDILRLIRGHDLIPPGSTVLVAVSAGPDSTALLHILARLRPVLACSLVCAHINHGLRPDETKQEAESVRRLARLLAVPFFRFQVDTKAHMHEHGLSLEHAARDLRYARLRSCAREQGAALIAVGHTADDQAEEVLHRLLRGSGRKGIGGMALKNRDIIRPLLQTSKKQLLDYLDRHDIPFCRDSSNDDTRFLRNRIRHVLLPLLERDFDPGIRRSLCKSAENLQEDEDFLKQNLDRLWPDLIRADGGEYRLNREYLASLHPCLRRRAVERLLHALGAKARYAHILAVLDGAARGRAGSELHLGQGLRVKIAKNELIFSYPRGRGAFRGRLG
jgi:tRNA(Ile)-lysidine synthase